MGYTATKSPSPPPTGKSPGQGLPVPPKGGSGETKPGPQQYECEYCGTIRITVEDKCASCAAGRIKIP